MLDLSLVTSARACRQVADGRLVFLLDLCEQDSWPPSEPNHVRRTDPKYDDDEEYEMTLPASPWTYENGDLNPDLTPSNARGLSSMRRRGPVANVPPYHPDYVASTTAGDYNSSSVTDSDEERYSGGGPGHHIRRGSEGYEVQPVDREEILRRYIMTRGEEAGRYKRYVPEPDSASDSGVGGWEDGVDDDDIPIESGIIAQHEAIP